MLLAVGDRYEAQIAADRAAGREVPLDADDLRRRFVFYLFAAILVFAALRVITARNPVHAVLWLVLASSPPPRIWLLLRAEFLAIALVLVYVGAVMVLFLFVVMMLDVNFDKPAPELHELPAASARRRRAGARSRWRWCSSASAIGAADGAPPPPAGGNTQALGRLLYVDYVYPFEIAAVILLVAIIAAIALTHRKRRETKYQDPGEQVKVRREDRVRLLDLPAEKKEG